MGRLRIWERLRGREGSGRWSCRRGRDALGAQEGMSWRVGKGEVGRTVLRLSVFASEVGIGIEYACGLGVGLSLRKYFEKAKKDVR